MKIQLSEHFTYKKLLQFVFPSIIMMIFTSIYSVVDGLFISNFVGKSAFAAVNLIMPFLMGISALGFMIGTGGSAIVAKTLGEGKIENANEYFSMLVYITAFGGIIIAILSMFLVKPVAILFGASGTLLDNCILYGRILCISLPAFMLQNVFQSFFVTAEKPHLGLRVIVIAGVTNMVLDFLFVAVLHLGLPGAGFATVCGEFIGGLFPLFYFGRKNSSLLKLGKTHFHGRILLKTCTNGSSELMTNLSSSVVNALYNMQLIATPLATLFVGYDQGLFELTRSGFRLYSFAFLINGFNIYGSAFFTALNNGLLSALISFLRTLVFQMAVVLLLPLLLGINGVWCSVAIAELLTLCITGTFIVLKRNIYHYL